MTLRVISNDTLMRGFSMQLSGGGRSGARILLGMASNPVPSEMPIKRERIPQPFPQAL